MKKILANPFLGFFAGWLALLDHCLVATANASFSGATVVVLVSRCACARGT
jgi:hypothetical protein